MMKVCVEGEVEKYVYFEICFVNTKKSKCPNRLKCQLQSKILY